MGPVDVTVATDVLVTTMLAGVRVVAFLLVAPPFAQKGVPGTVKVAIAMGIALAVSPRLERFGDGSTGAFVTALVLQAVTGAALGFAVSLAFSAVQAAGALLDLVGGFQMAAAYDPLSATMAGPLQRFYTLTAMTLLFVSDGYQVVLSGLVRSFDAVPLDATLDLDRLAAGLTAGLSQMVVAALQVAGPLVVVLFLADVGLGLLTRVAPALNAFAMGFPLKILLTLVMGSLAYVALPGVVETLTGQGVDLLTGVTP
ncbi:flagellar biosynthetic protein FliR [Cellulomonas endophytica]|uniref:flagellar biosynthetic protein FliR n=1 Tax=Cellulomonas endophytica TaxID=2494735 RepID=UPI001F0B91CA|nr:flagellar biosynthetic protein FliR [Cellulomonas endophytica]